MAASGGAYRAMIDFSSNHFDLLGLPVRFGVDADALERAYRQLQSEVHPDRYAGGDQAQQRLAMEASSRVNEAYRALKNPVDRARYLLMLRGIDVDAEARSALDVEFLERQLERREIAADAMTDEDVPTLEALLVEVREERKAIEVELGSLLDRYGAADVASKRLHEMTFLDKLAADVDAMLGELEY